MLGYEILLEFAEDNILMNGIGFTKEFTNKTVQGTTSTNQTTCLVRTTVGIMEI